jgi:hypothetical protein
VGFNGCWIAVKDKTPESLAEDIGFQIVEGSALDHPLEASHGAGLLENGWALVVLGHFEERLLDKQLLRRLSAETRVVACLVSESAMISSSTFWASGQQIWRILHDCQTGDVNHLAIEGERLPKSIEAHRKKAIAERAKDDEVDFMFDVPLYAAREMTGFKHDEEVPKGATFSEIKLPSLTSPKPWWRFW